MSLCAANSGPLSVAKAYRKSLYGSNNFLTAFARDFDCFPNGSFRISSILVDFSTSVSMACWSGSTIKSVTKSPKLFPSTFLLLSWMLTLSLIGRCPPLGRCLYFILGLVCLASSPVVSLWIMLQMDWWATFIPSFLRRFLAERCGQPLGEGEPFYCTSFWNLQFTSAWLILQRSHVVP